MDAKFKTNVIFCRFQSDQIGSMCFMIDWYQLPAKSVRSLILMIAMSSQPMKISAGRMIDLSLTTFGTVRNYCSILSMRSKSIILKINLSF